MTALAMGVRELNFDEIGFVSGGDQEQAENIRDGLIVAAILYVASNPVLLGAAIAWALSATPAHGNGSENR